MKEIKVLGTGCPKCKKMAALAEEAAKEMNVEYNLEKVTDINDIMEYGVMITPALVIDGKVKVAGKIPKIDDIKNMISE